MVSSAHECRCCCSASSSCCRCEDLSRAEKQRRGGCEGDPKNDIAVLDSAHPVGIEKLSADGYLSNSQEKTSPQDMRRGSVDVTFLKSYSVRPQDPAVKMGPSSHVS